MKKENTMENIAIKKKQTKIICYISLVFLIVLLFLPPLLRTFVQEKPEKKKDEVVVINCNKTDESINSTFLNGKPQNILYSVKGDVREVEQEQPDEEISSSTNSISGEVVDNGTVTSQTEDESDTIVDTKENTLDTENSSNIDNSQNSDNEFYQLIAEYSTIEYNSESDISSIRLNVQDLASLNQYNTIFITPDQQVNYFGSKGFVCTTTKLD